MDKQNAIEVRNVYKHFKIEKNRANTIKDKLIHFRRGSIEYHKVLQDINLNIKKGETVALIGTNGSGKSTLLKLMTKIIVPNQGTIETNGKLTSLLELGAGFHQDFTGRENIYFNASIFGLNRRQIDQRIDQIIAFSELNEFIDQPVRTYSSGMYMRLAFSVAINVDAEILLIDEILAVGDQHFQDKCLRKLEELKNSGKTIVIVSHSLDVVKKLCNRAIWIYHGQVRADGHPSYVVEEYLNQVAIDHKEKRKQEIKEGKQSHRGIVHIDIPVDFASISKDQESFDLIGWQISTCDQDRLQIKIDDKESQNLVIQRIPREDVYTLFAQDYAGFMDVNTIGWSTKLTLEEGQHKIEVLCLDQDENVLAQKEISIKIV